MNKILILFVIVFFAPGVTDATTVQWDGNYNSFELFYEDSFISWEEAETAAEESGGHLATLTTAAENTFVWNFLINNLIGDSSYRDYWLGGYQEDGANENEGEWKWVTGESVDMSPSSWHKGEPNNDAGGTQDYLHYWDTKTGLWDDMENGRYMSGYIVEYENHAENDGAAPVPEPATLMLFGSGLLGIANFRRKFTKV